VVPATGAYCYTMANNYNGSRRIPVVFAGDGAARLVVRRETWDDLVARDVT
jgi:diaminopimelate decarboxylase